MEEKIHKLESGEEEVEYYLNFFPILKTICDDKTDGNTTKTKKTGKLDQFVESEIDDTKETIYNEYVKTFRQDLELYNNPVQPEELPCNHCGEIDFITDSRQGCIICTKCGTTEALFENTAANLNYNQGEIEQVTQFSYKRINHFQECLSQFQAKESTEIPPKIIDALLEELKKTSNSRPQSYNT